MAVSRTIRDLLDSLPGRAKAIAGWDGSDVQIMAVDSSGNQKIVQVAATSGGASQSKTVSAASTNATVVKASAGQVFGIVVNNVNAAVRYLKLYNKATAPTVGTDVPVKTIAIPAGQVVEITRPGGLEFSAGIAFALTTEATDAGTTGVAANEHVVNIDYK